MNHLNFLKKAILGLCLLCLTCVGVAAQNVKPFVIPELKEWQGKDGAFVPSEKTCIVYGNAALQSIAEAFAADWKEMFGNALQVKAGKPQAGDSI